MAAEATDRVEVTIPKNTTNTVVNLQPGDVSSINLLLIKSSSYEGIKFKTNDGASDSRELILSGPQFYSGGSVALFEKAPRKLQFYNSSDEDIRIEIFVARDATAVPTPTPPPTPAS